MDIVPILQIPKVDVSILHSSSTQGANELKKLRLALSLCGYFQVVNHGIEIASLDELYDVAKRFFSLPLEEKQKYSRPSDDFDGFGKDQILTENQTLDCDRLYLNLDIEDKRRLKAWPGNPKDFRKVLLHHTAKLKMLNELILKAMAKSLDLEENCFLKQYAEHPDVLSMFNFYPPRPSPDCTLGAKARADASVLSFRLQDKEAEGLQALMDNQWFRIPVVGYAILVNTGDLAERMTNGIFKSTPINRVVANSAMERITIATFFKLDKENSIKPAEGFIDEKKIR